MRSNLPSTTTARARAQIHGGGSSSAMEVLAGEVACMVLRRRSSGCHLLPHRCGTPSPRPARGGGSRGRGKWEQHVRGGATVIPSRGH
jgi:hypothetical protein